MSDDVYNLQRFVDAQANVFDQIRIELNDGHKCSHWMWFVFPQLHGLGASPLAIKFAISSIEEAQAYLRHSLLGSRLRECCELVIKIEGRSIERIFEYPDNLKFQSCMTLFAYATPDNWIFKMTLQKYFSGDFDPPTIEGLGIKIV